MVFVCIIASSYPCAPIIHRWAASVYPTPIHLRQHAPDESSVVCAAIQAPNRSPAAPRKPQPSCLSPTRYSPAARGFAAGSLAGCATIPRHSCTIMRCAGTRTNPRSHRRHITGTYAVFAGHISSISHLPTAAPELLPEARQPAPVHYIVIIYACKLLLLCRGLALIIAAAPGPTQLAQGAPTHRTTAARLLIGGIKAELPPRLLQFILGKRGLCPWCGMSATFAR